MPCYLATMENLINVLPFPQNQIESCIKAASTVEILSKLEDCLIVQELAYEQGIPIHGKAEVNLAVEELALLLAQELDFRLARNESLTH